MHSCHETKNVAKWDRVHRKPPPQKKINPRELTSKNICFDALDMKTPNKTLSKLAYKRGW